MRRLKLKQFLMKTGRFSDKQEVIKVIHDGLISVDGSVIKDTDYGVKTKHVIKFQGEILFLVSKHIYFMLNKPKACLCQKGAEFNVYDIVKKIDFLSDEEKKSLFAIGRLDKYTSGLLLLSNDGKLSDKLMKPDNKVQKTYIASLDKILSKTDKERLEKGVTISLSDKDYRTKISKISFIESESRTIVKISICEGKKRQVRKMFFALGYEVLELERISIGKIELGSLKIGELKALSKEDVNNALKKS